MHPHKKSTCTVHVILVDPSPYPVLSIPPTVVFNRAKTCLGNKNLSDPCCQDMSWQQGLFTPLLPRPVLAITSRRVLAATTCRVNRLALLCMLFVSFLVYNSGPKGQNAHL